MRAKGKLFMNGRSQAVRLPAEFRFEGKEVEIERDPVTGGIILFQEKKAPGTWDDFFRLRDEIDPDELKDFMADREQGESQRDDIFDDL